MLRRHSLVWPTPEGWSALLADVAEEWRSALDGWRRADWPLVVRRRDPDVAPEALCVGLGLPPDCDGAKRRLPLRMAPPLVCKTALPLALGEIIHVAPECWRDNLRALAANAEAQHICLRVFGSLAMQRLTGAGYLTPDSDVDLLVEPTSCRQLAEGIWLLSRFASRLPLDGEIVFPSGDAVSWKEWANAISAPRPLRVLVKGQNEVRLAGPEELLAQFRDTDG